MHSFSFYEIKNKPPFADKCVKYLFITEMSVVIVYQPQKSSYAIASGATTKVHQGFVSSSASSQALANHVYVPPAPIWGLPAVKNCCVQSD